MRGISKPSHVACICGRFQQIAASEIVLMQVISGGIAGGGGGGEGGGGEGGGGVGGGEGGGEGGGGEGGGGLYCGAHSWRPRRVLRLSSRRREPQMLSAEPSQPEVWSRRFFWRAS